MKRLVVLTLVALLLVPTALPVEAAETQAEGSAVTTGRPVDDITVSVADGSLDVAVTDDDPTGTTLTLDRSWLRDQLGKPVEFMRFHRNGELVSSYRLTNDQVILEVPHFSTQTFTVDTVDSQFEVTGSVAGGSTTRIINYDVNETGIAVLKIAGAGDREGTKRVDQFTPVYDNQTFQWETGKIPRNVTLTFEGTGNKYGPTYNKSTQDVSDGTTVAVDLVAKDYTPSVEVVGAGQRNGTRVTKGPYTGDQLLSFDYVQRNETVVLLGKTSFTNDSVSQDFSNGLGSPDSSSNVEVQNGELVLSEVSTTTTHDFTNYTAYQGGSQITVNSDTSFSVSSSSSDTTFGRPISNPTEIQKIEYQRTVSSYNEYDFWNVGLATGNGGIGSADIVGDNWGTSGTLYPSYHSLSTEGGRNTAVEQPSTGTTYYYTIDYDWSAGEVTAYIYSDSGRSNLVGSATSSFDTSRDWSYIYAISTRSSGTGSLGGTLQEVKVSRQGTADSGHWEKAYTTDEVDSFTPDWTDSGSPVVKMATGAQSPSQVSKNTEYDGGNRTGLTVRLELDSNSDAISSFNTDLTIRNVTEDPRIDVDGDNTYEVTYTGELPEGQTVVENVTLTSQSPTFYTDTTGAKVDWRYEGNSEARAHVKNVTVNGVGYDINQFIAGDESVTVDVSQTDTLQGTNNLQVNLRDDSETQYVNRLDLRGQYEGRTVLDNYTVNGQTVNLDEALDKDETTSVNITSESTFGENGIRVQLQENTTADSANIDITWYPENRTRFQNVTVNGDVYANNRFLGAGETLTFNVTDSISSGDNTHTFSLNDSVSTTATADFTEKVEFRKNVSVSIDEAWASYSKSLSTSFSQDVTSGTQFNLSVPDRVLTHAGTTVTIDGTSAQHATDFDGGELTVTVQESIPGGSTVAVQSGFRKYRVTNASATLTAENDRSQPYSVELGVSGVGGPVGYADAQQIFNADTYEVLATDGGTVTADITPAVLFDGNLTIPESALDDGFIIHRPQWSNVTYTGTTNVVYPTTGTGPDNRYIEHTPVLQPDADPVPSFTVQNQIGVVEVTWKTTTPYHKQLQTAASTDHTLVLQNVTADGVQVYQDGEAVEATRVGDELRINASTGATWDIYAFDNLTLANDPSVATSGDTETFTVQVTNPNEFTVHGARLSVPHGWVTDISPRYQAIGPGETVNITVTIDVPAGTTPATYDLPLSIRSQETGMVSLGTVPVTVGGGGGQASTAGYGLPAFLIAGAVLLVIVGVIWQLARSGKLGNIVKARDEVKR